MEWGEVDKGKTIDLLCKVAVFDVEHDAHIMELVHNRSKFILSGLIEAGYESYTVFDATMESQFPIPKVCLGPSSCIFGHREISWDGLLSVIDMCSGFGGMAQGVLPSGFHSTVAVDHNDRMLKLYSQASSIPTVLGDVADKKVLRQVWMNALGARTMTGGFSCQPFSSLGDLRSSADPRSSCLSRLLYAAFYMRIHILVLECVAPAATDQFVRSELEYFCKVTGFSCTQKNLKLDQVWPCKRNRAWWVLCSPTIGQVTIPDFKCTHPVSTIERIIPFISQWDKNDEEALCLSGDELFAFGGHEQDFSKHLMNSQGKAPCALHAWGNQLTPCPCGCRPAGLSAKRLEEKGLFGLLVHSAPDVEGRTCIRHVHPCEALALNGMDPTLDFGTNPRLILSAVGQLASPIHVVWIMSSIASQLDHLKFGQPLVNPETQLHAYMSWLISRCNLVWPTPTTLQPTDKFASLLECWSNHENLSLAELLFPDRWDGKIDMPVHLAAILDWLFREQQQKADVNMGPGPQDDGTPDPETPWLDMPVVSNEPNRLPGLDVEFCTVYFDGDMLAPVKLTPFVGTKLKDLLDAHGKLVGMFPNCQCTDSEGTKLSCDHILQVGQVIHVQTEKFDSEMHHMQTEAGEPISVTHIDVSPTATWTQKTAEHVFQKPSIYDIGECSVENLKDQPEWLCADPLLGLKGKQFLMLSAPQIATPQQLWAIRHQFVKVADRLAILENQGPMFADDELRYHLFALGQKYIDMQVRFSKDPVKQLVVIDPLITTAWMQNKGFSCDAWGADHGFIHNKSLPVAAVFHVAGHWVPVLMCPHGDALNVSVWDADAGNHLQLNSVIEKIGLALGFVSVIIQRDRREFHSSDMCGTLAIAYLQNALLREHLPANPAETMQRMQLYRQLFVQHIAKCDITKRPWIWGNGDQIPTLHDVAQNSSAIPIPNMLTAEQRIELIIDHGKAVADDEIRFHLQHIIDRYHAISETEGIPLDVDFVFFEPLTFTCWESIGRTISSRWCDRHPEISAEGVQVITAFHVDNHWFPLWWVPRGQCLTFNTIAHDTADAHQLRDVCACIGQQIGFSHFALHVNPNHLTEHDMCGAQAMMYLAHVVHQAPMPEEVADLHTVHTNMRAAFVENVLSKREVPAPVLWGNGSSARESGPLPIMPSVPASDFPMPETETEVCSPSFQQGGEPAAMLTTQEVDWPLVCNLFRWNAAIDQPCILPPVACQVHSQVMAIHETTAMEAVEVAFHVSRLEKALKEANRSMCCPTVQVLSEMTELLPFMKEFQFSCQSAMVHVVRVHLHWAPVVFVKSGICCRIFVPSDIQHDVQDLVGNDSNYVIQGIPQKFQHNLCGAQACDVLHSLFCGAQVAPTVEELECWHLQLRQDFLAFGGFGWQSNLFGFGPQGTLVKDLASELVKHGVPQDFAESRASEAIKSIGSEQIIAALAHRQPWRQLKTLGNNHKFKFVLPSELAATFDGKPTSKGKGKGKTRPLLAQALEIDPSKLQLLDGLFRALGRVIPQIHTKQIGPVSSGVIVMSHAEAEPYLRTGKAVSTEPLAMLVLHRPDADFRTALPLHDHSALSVYSRQRTHAC